MGDAALVCSDHGFVGFGLSVREPTAGDGTDVLLISEIFGPTIQGEGLGLGLPAVFLRVAGCPLRCTWCDTAYSWDWSKHDRASNTRTVTAGEAWAEVLGLAAGSQARTLVLTGGEPAAQGGALLPVATAAKKAGWRVEMETSGAVDPGPLVQQLNLITVSPKMSGAGMKEERRLKPAVITLLAKMDTVAWKFVIEDERDLVEADELVAAYGLRNVSVMAQATTAHDVIERTRWLVPFAVQRGYRVTPRLHTILWGDERGR